MVGNVGRNKALSNLMDRWSSVSCAIIDCGYETKEETGMTIVPYNLYAMIEHWYYKFQEMANSSDNSVMYAGTWALIKNKCQLFYENIVDFYVLDTYVRLINAQILYNQDGSLHLSNVPNFVQESVRIYLKEN